MSVKPGESLYQEPEPLPSDGAGDPSFDKLRAAASELAAVRSAMNLTRKRETMLTERVKDLMGQLGETDIEATDSQTETTYRIKLADVTRMEYDFRSFVQKYPGHVLTLAEMNLVSTTETKLKPHTGAVDAVDTLRNGYAMPTSSSRLSIEKV